MAFGLEEREIRVDEEETPKMRGGRSAGTLWSRSGELGTRRFAAVR
jgi:hypothetical protein